MILGIHSGQFEGDRARARGDENILETIREIFWDTKMKEEFLGS